MLKIKKIIHSCLYGNPKNKYINGTKGVISLFLALIILPFTLVAGSLINAARVNSAVAIFDEALCNASNSTLGTYDQFLRKRFGLLAMKQEVSGKSDTLNEKEVSKLISDTFNEYLKENLKTLSNTYTNVKSESMGVYPLADKNVLMTEILEYSKYSVPAKLVEDNLSLDKLVETFEDSFSYKFKNILTVITSGSKLADSVLTMAETYEQLKTAVRDEQIAYQNYNNCYSAFESAVSAYLDKKTEMQNELNRQQGEIDSKESSIENVTNQIEALNNQITELQKLEEEKNQQETEAGENQDLNNQQETEIAQDQNSNTEPENTEDENAKKIEELNKQIEELNKNNEETLKAYNEAKANYESTKASYENELATLRETIDSSKKEYSSSISTLSGKVSTVGEKVSATQRSLASFGSTVSGTIVDGVTLASGLTKTEDEVKELEEKISKEKDAAKKSEFEQQLKEKKASLSELKTQKTILDAEKTGVNDCYNDLKIEIGKINVAQYSEWVNQFRELKAKVDSYGKTDSEQVDYSKITEKIDKSEYYLVLSGRLTEDMVKKAESNAVKECTKESIWAVIKVLISFVEALCNISTIYDTRLKAVIDTDYYNETYGGLPSQKSRTEHPLNYGVSSDKEKSEEFKKLFGDYSSADVKASQDYDVISALSNVASNIGTISVNVTAMKTVFGLLTFAKHFHNITVAIKEIVQNIKSIVNYFANAISKTAMGSKMLLTGYASYMTSNRTNYSTGTTLNKVSFNERQQETSGGDMSLEVFNEFKELFSVLTGNFDAGSKEKCFVGAETEYLIWGTKAECSNQAAAWLTIYGIRLVTDLIPIRMNGEVAAIAAASTLGAPLVYLFYIMVEPLADTLILVNGGDLELIKTVVYLTPSGFKGLLKKFKGLGLVSKKLEKSGDNLQETTKNIDGAKTNENKTDNSSDESVLRMDYQKTLWLIMTIFTPTDKLLARLSDIIEMEAVEYNINTQIGSNQLFDLDYSYTYIRTQASFSTNEFIKMSNEQGINCKERIIYKGY